MGLVVRVSRVDVTASRGPAGTKSALILGLAGPVSERGRAASSPGTSELSGVGTRCVC